VLALDPAARKRSLAQPEKSSRLNLERLCISTPEACGDCADRAKYTLAASGKGRSVSIAKDEALQKRFRKLQNSPTGRLAVVAGEQHHGVVDRVRDHAGPKAATGPKQAARKYAEQELRHHVAIEVG
jgi:hypothetical protein